MKSKYIKPSAECLPCMACSLLQDSVKTLPFIPGGGGGDGTTEALSKEADLVDEDTECEKVMDTKMHYKLGQKDGNWYDAIDNIMGME